MEWSVSISSRRKEANDKYSCYQIGVLPGAVTGLGQQYVVKRDMLFQLTRVGGQNDLLIVSTLDLIQGILLLHPPSRSLFGREIYMNVRSHVLTLQTMLTLQLLLDLLDPSNCPAIQSHTLLVLVCALLDRPHNTRTFENIDGILTVTSLFKSRSTSREVKLKVVEFLYFYLMPETSSAVSVSAPVTAVVQRSPSKLGVYSRSATGVLSDDKAIKSTQEKQRLLGMYLNNVEDLVEDLRDNAPFGEMVY